MSQNHPETLTQHAMLVVWGQYAQSIGLIDQIQSVSLHQKTVEHSPQRKILEFLVASLAGLEHLQDLSRSAHPIDQDRAVAKAWGQSDWADYNGVSRTLSDLTQAEAEQIAAGLERISRPIAGSATRTLSHWRQSRADSLRHHSSASIDRTSSTWIGSTNCDRAGTASGK